MFPQQKRLPPTVCLMFSKEATPSVIFTGYDPIPQDQATILVMLIHLAARGTYIPCKLGTERGEEMFCIFVTWFVDKIAQQRSCLALSSHPYRRP